MHVADAGSLQLDKSLADIHKLAQDTLSDVSQFNDNTSALRALFDKSLASAARARNAALSLQSRLPDELWCIAWQDLPLTDRVSILRVCHAWRAIALSVPRVWGLLDVSMDLHSDDCECELCQDEEAGLQELYLRRPPRTNARSNLQLIPRALALGKNAPITLQVQDSARTSDDGAHAFLGTLLKPHAARLRAVYFEIADNWVVKSFMDLLCTSGASFPLLRVLSIRCEYSLCSHEPDEFAVAPVDAPALEEIVLPRCLSWLQGLPRGVTSLCAFTGPARTLKDLAVLLEACPGLARLTVELLPLQDGPGTSSDAEPMPASARHAARRLTELTVRGVTESNEEGLLDLLAPEIRTITLWYATEDCPSTRALQGFIADCTPTDTEPLTIACASGDGFNTFQLSRATSQSRQIIQNDSAPALLHTWKTFCAAGARNLMFDCTTAPTLLSTDVAPQPMPNVIVFSLLLWNAPQLEELVRVLRGRPPMEELLPGLCAVSVHAQKTVSPVCVRAQTLLDLLDILVPKERLKYVDFDMIKPEGDTQELRLLVERIEGLYPAPRNV
ncbi:hypothetical protein EXIGLDRAFT_828415 [Exidia glandulosa HHB12029]|uniref:F-box domain-containing protein n=1 Tax=Exidia glandulosa HHB12029 TaxID=1314781 RepID=A0A165QFF6_EXIGL|nr:hypothetical protein EXIGLDRAFT_828415 [Exidia glandulosa HHB12029]